jgi:uncharacterized protein
VDSQSAPPARRLTFAYVGPFVAFIVIMAIERGVQLSPLWLYPIRFFVVLGVLLAFSWRVVPLRVSSPALSIAIGVAVFVIWIGPDVLFGPAYRHHWLFSNVITGEAVSSLPPEAQRQFWFLTLRAVSCTLLVPVMEELFWRGWLMRWVIDHHFFKVPMGTYTPMAFWTVALLFASEHGSYWEVGLAAGIIYNWWMIRTRSLADCQLAHAVTNGLLSAYVLLTGHWQYWL